MLPVVFLADHHEAAWCDELEIVEGVDVFFSHEFDRPWNHEADAF